MSGLRLGRVRRLVLVVLGGAVRVVSVALARVALIAATVRRRIRGLPGRVRVRGSGVALVPAALLGSGEREQLVVRLVVVVVQTCTVVERRDCRIVVSEVALASERT